jgi:hypothetical protein
MEKFQCSNCKKELDDNLFSIKKNGVKNKVCQICSEKFSKKYKNRLKNNLCGICGKTTPIDNKIYCQPCLQKCLITQKKRRLLLIKNGLCVTCGHSKPTLNNTRCFKCYSLHKLPLKIKIFINEKERAKKSGIEFSIEEEDIIIPDFCPIFKIKLQENKGLSKYNSYSLDRIDNTKGYIKGNIHVISFKANSIKNNSTIEELELLLMYLKSLPYT